MRMLIGLVLLAALAAFHQGVVVGAGSKAACGEFDPSGSPAATESMSRFGVVDIYIDSGEQGLAAYQFEFKLRKGDVQIVGIERGDDAGFHDPPYYDPAALTQQRILVGSFKTAGELPTGNTRVARLHVRIGGPEKPDYELKLMVAGSVEGKPISARASFKQGV
jgi:hypothetical protein